MAALPPSFLTTANRIVIKLGTQVAVDADGRLAQDRLTAIVNACVALHQQGKTVILVSSGAVGLGLNRLQLSGQLSLNEKQACAAVGQNLLMDAYQALFQPAGLITAQVLLTALDFADRKHYLNIRQTLETLLKLKVIPVINENDTTSTMELQDEGYTKGFGDNDKLSALVAAKLDADLLVILTNVDGIYTENPENNPDAVKIPLIRNFAELQQIQSSGQSAMGRGGMSSKLQAAKIAAISGVHTYITSGLHPEPLRALFASAQEDVPGTLVLPQSSLLNGKKRWIGVASGYHGTLIVNDGARKALVQQHASLLAVGVVGVQGEFSAGQVVSLQDEQGGEIGRGLCAYSSDDATRMQGQHSDDLSQQEGFSPERPELVHRDNLVIFEEYGLS